MLQYSVEAQTGGDLCTLGAVLAAEAEIVAACRDGSAA